MTLHVVTFRAAQHLSILAAVLVASLMPARVRAQPAPSDVRPILECVLNHGDGMRSAFFGYKNDNASTVEIPVGTDNRFSPLPQDRGQATAFAPGRTPFYPQAAFAVVWDGSGNLVWTLKGPNGVQRTATAAPSNPAQACLTKLPEGATCSVNGQCASGTCTDSACQPAAAVPALGGLTWLPLAIALAGLGSASRRRKRANP